MAAGDVVCDREEKPTATGGFGISEGRVNNAWSISRGATGSKTIDAMNDLEGYSSRGVRCQDVRCYLIVGELRGVDGRFRDYFDIPAVELGHVRHLDRDIESAVHG